MRTEILEKYEESNIGLPYPVILLNAAQVVYDDDGKEIGISIPHEEGMIQRIAVIRCNIFPQRLSGAEIRFMRTALGMTQKEFAQQLSAKVETISRWENGMFMPEERAEKLIRLMVLEYIAGQFEEINGTAVFQMGLRSRFPEGKGPKIILKLANDITDSATAKDWKEVA